MESTAKGCGRAAEPWSLELRASRSAAELLSGEPWRRDCTASLDARAGEPPTARLEEALEAIARQSRSLALEVCAEPEALDERWRPFLLRWEASVLLLPPEAALPRPGGAPEPAPNWDRLAAGLERLRAWGVPCAVRVPVRSPGADRVEAAYAALRALGVGCMQFVPGAPREGGAGYPRRSDLSPEVWFACLRRLFELWLAARGAGERVFIGEFEALSAAIRGAVPEKRLRLLREEGEPLALGGGGALPPACRLCRWARFCRDYLEALALGAGVRLPGGPRFCAACGAFYEAALPKMLDHLRRQSRQNPR